MFVINFDLDNTLLEIDGFTRSQIVTIYQKEVRHALFLCGFEKYPQGSVYISDQNNAWRHDHISKHGEEELVDFISDQLTRFAPRFCRYVRNIMLSRFVTSFAHQLK